MNKKEKKAQKWDNKNIQSQMRKWLHDHIHEKNEMGVKYKNRRNAFAIAYGVNPDTLSKMLNPKYNIGFEFLRFLFSMEKVGHPAKEGYFKI